MIISFEDRKPLVKGVVAESARVIGDVEIGLNSSVWSYSVLRGDYGKIRVGEYCNIQEFCMLHADADFPCLVGDKVTVAHGVLLHSCRINEYVFIGAGARIMENVEIGENCVVMPGAVIRADLGRITIGNNSVVEDNCVIHSGSLTGVEDIVIGENVIIGHGAVNHARKIGNNVLIGMNATILHDAEIGDFSIIAAGSLVKQGTKVPDKSFVTGIPGRVKKEVSQEQLAWTELGSQAYIELAKQYRKEGL